MLPDSAAARARLPAATSTLRFRPHCVASGLCLAGLLLAEGLSAPGAHSAVTNQGKEPRWQTWSEACEAVLAFWGGSAWRLVPRTNPAINGRPGPHGYTCQTLTPRGWIRRSTLWAICGPGERGSLIAEDGCAPKGASPKNLGAISCPPLVGNPIHAGTGNKFQTETDYRGAGPRTLRFVRYYNSLSERASPFFGLNWRSNFDRSLFATPRPRVHVFRPDGQELVFTPAGGGWRSDPDVTARLLERADGWEYIDADDTVERYDVKGRLQSIRTRDGYTQTLTWEGKKISTVSDAHGRALRFAYADGRLVSVTDPEGRVTTYGYDARSNLSTVTYPDDTPEDLADNPTRRYHYENPDYPHHLTGLTDANGDRFATWAYDAQGRAVLSEHAGGADRLSVTYTTDGSAVLTDALGATRTYAFETRFDLIRPTAAAGDPCTGCAGLARRYTYDANGFPASRTDFNGHRSTFVHDERGLERSRTEAAATAVERTITTAWHPDFRLPARIAEPGRITTFDYDANGRLLARTETDADTGASRTTRFTYTPEGLLAAVDGPRTDVEDVTTRAYDAQGNLVRTTNALGHTTRITAHDASGRPLALEDPNGVVTTLAYDARGRLVRRTLDGHATHFAYDRAGNLARTTLGDGSSLTYTYDGAHRLIAIADGAGNRIEYTLDARGNRIREDVMDPAGALRRTQSRVHDAMGRLIERIGGEGQSTHLAYDANGNPITTIDPAGNVTERSFDALDRLIATYDALDGVTDFGYDARDNLIRVTDPRGLITTFAYDGLDNRIERASPDSGLTTWTYDAAGNPLTETDARGVTARFRYDALNRLTTIDYPDDAEDVLFSYDEGPNGIGRLTGMADESGTTSFAYDARGNLFVQTTTLDDVVHTLRYAYDAADRLVRIVYPSGRAVDYERDAAGRIVAVSTTHEDETQTLARDVSHLPFGPLRALAFGNGLALERRFDRDFRLTEQRAGAVQDLTFAYDPNDNVSAIFDNLAPERDQHFAYDALDRLLSAQGAYGHIAYTYDALGNRLTRDHDGLLARYSYAPDSNRLAEITNGARRPFAYDAAGNTVDDGRFAFDYGERSRLHRVHAGAVPVAQYAYNAHGERVKKTANGITTLFYYDRGGRLLAETDGEGEVLKEYIYLEGRPLAVVSAAAPEARAGTHRFQGNDPVSGAPVSLSVDESDRSIVVHTPALEGTYTVDAHDWRADGQRIHITHRPDRRTRLEASLHLDAPSRTSSLTVATRPRRAVYRMDTRLGTQEYRGRDRRTGGELTLRIDRAAGTLRLTETGLSKPALEIPKDHWAEWRFRWLRVIFVRYRTPEHRISGILWAAGNRVRGSVHLREGRRERSTYSLTAAPPPPPAEPAGIFYVHTDHLGTPHALTDDAQAIAWQADYLPFGDATVTTETLTFNLRLPGQYHDRLTGLNYNRFRYYASNIGRYLSSDPSGLAGGFNAFVYVAANPLRYVDPHGLDVWEPDQLPAGDGFVNAGALAGGAFMLGAVGLSIFSGIIVDTSGQVCAISQICGRFGFGLFGGLGLAGTIGVSEGRLRSGPARAGGLFIESGGGLTAGTSISFAREGAFNFGKGFGGVGGGFAAGIENCFIRIVCPDPDECVVQ